MASDAFTGTFGDTVGVPVPGEQLESFGAEPARYMPNPGHKMEGSGDKAKWVRLTLDQQHAQAKAIRQMFKSFKPDELQPHSLETFLIVNGFTVEDAKEALGSWRTTGFWEAPNGTCFGEPKK